MNIGKDGLWEVSIRQVLDRVSDAVTFIDNERVMRLGESRFMVRALRAVCWPES